jgi:gas vesicle protein
LLYTEGLEDNLMADNNGGANLAWFLVGGALGATAALLLAPQTGTETREYLRRRTEDGRGRLADSGREALERGREYYDRGKEIADDAADLFEKGKEALSRVKTAADASRGSADASEAPS